MSGYRLGRGPVWHSSWPPGRVEPNRRLYDFELVYFSRGEGQVIFDDRVCECRAGSVVIIPPKVVHCTIARTGVERWCIHFDWFGDCRKHAGSSPASAVFVYNDKNGAFQEEDTAAMPELPGIVFPVFRQEVSPEILPLLQHYFLPVEESLGAQFMRQGLLMQILGLVFLEKETPRSKIPECGRLFFKAKNLIDTRYLENHLSVTEIAAEFHVTANHLTKLFHASLGMSVTDYIQARRLRFSRKLLAETALTVREIAFASGFNDPNYFTRFFLKKTGRTPGAYRREIATRFDADEE